MDWTEEKREIVFDVQWKSEINVDFGMNRKKLMTKLSVVCCIDVFK